MEKTFREWLEILPQHIQKQYLENYRPRETPFEERIASGFSSFINTGFAWTDTPQNTYGKTSGRSYWYMVSHLNILEDGTIYPKSLEGLYEEFPQYSIRDKIINDYEIY